MATIISPSRGQPLDVTLIASLVDAVSDLQNSSITSTQSKINDVSVNSSSIKIYAKTQSININNITTIQEKPFYFEYPTYGSDPIAIAGITNVTSTVSGGNAATVVLTSVSENRAEGIIKFPSGSTGSVTIDINIIVIGTA